MAEPWPASHDDAFFTQTDLAAFAEPRQDAPSGGRLGAIKADMADFRLRRSDALWIVAELEHLRDVLAPLLEQPYEIVGLNQDDELVSACRFCGRDRDQAHTHEPGCAVLDRDRLLGR